jgi:hypothetical protein
VPLSDHEQRLLDSIERALYAEDPKFASTVRATDLRAHVRRRVRRAAVLVGLGVILLVAGPVTQIIALGIVGFLLMLAGVLLLATSYRRPGSNGGGSGGGGGGGGRGPRRGGPPKPGWKDRAEDRWRKRWEERDGR